MTVDTTETMVTTVDDRITEEEKRVAARIFLTRIHLAIPRHELASKANIDEPTLRMYEHAETPVPASDLVLISRALEVSYDYFYSENVRFGEDESLEYNASQYVPLQAALH